MRTKDLTKGSIFKSLIIFSMPMIAGNLLQQAYTIVDAWVLGKFVSADALAAAGSAYTLMVLVTSVIIGLCMGSGAYFASDFAGGDKALLNTDIKLSFVFIGAVTIFLYILLYAFLDRILFALNTPLELIKISREYISVIFSGIGFIFLYNFFTYLLRALGNSAIPLVFLVISAVLNIVLDIIFVTKYNFGVSGAALATVISQGVSAIGLLLYALFKMTHIIKPSFMASITTHRLKAVVFNDLATCIQQSVMNFGILMVQGLVNSFGASVMAAFAAAVKIDSVCYMPAQEFSNAFSLAVSQNYGVGNLARIKKSLNIAMFTSTIFCVALSIFIFMLAPELMKVFIAEHELSIISEGVTYLRIEGAFYTGIGILFLWYAYFRGIYKPKVSLFLTVISLGARVVISYTAVLAFGMGAQAIWWSIPVGWVLADIVGWIIYRGNKCGQTDTTSLFV